MRQRCCLGGFLGISQCLCTCGIFAVFGFAKATLFDHLVFLTAQQFSAAAGFFFAADQFGVFSGADLRLGLSRGLFGDRFGALITLDESALFTHFHLNRAGTAGGVGLFDFSGRFFDQGDLLALRAGGAMAGLQIAQEFLLVCIRQVVVGLRLGDTRAGQLLDQGRGGFIEFSCEFSDGGGTGHNWVSVRPP